MTTVTLGHNIGLSLTVLDQNGNPLLTPPTFDAPPVWTNTTPATETLKVAADGATAEADTVAAGTDVISVDAKIGGVDFTATLAVEVDAAPQVPTSLVINATVI